MSVNIVRAILQTGSNVIGKLAANSGVDIGDVDVLSSALPTGAATSAKQDTVIGHLDGVETVLGTIDADTSALAGAVAGTEVQVDVLTMPVVAVSQSGTWDEVGINDSGNSITVDNAQLSVVGTGTEAAALRVTIASDSTGVLSVDDNGAALTVDGTVTAELSATDNAVLDAIEADTTTLAGAVSGTEMQVDVVAALPAGTNAIGKLAANSGVDIGDVDVTSVIPGTGATNLGKAEDGAHTSGDVGVFVLGVRNDNAATTYGADQDYSPIAVDLKGRTIVAQKAATGTISSVADSASSVTVLAANAARLGASVYNDSTEILYIKAGATASATSFTVKMYPEDYWEAPAGYTGILDGIWSADASGSARVTEYT